MVSAASIVHRHIIPPFSWGRRTAASSNSTVDPSPPTDRPIDRTINEATSAPLMFLFPHLCQDRGPHRMLESIDCRTPSGRPKRRRAAVRACVFARRQGIQAHKSPNSKSVPHRLIGDVHDVQGPRAFHGCDIVSRSPIKPSLRRAPRHATDPEVVPRLLLASERAWLSSQQTRRAPAPGLLPAHIIC